MHLPKWLSGLCMWQGIQRESHHKKTDFAGWRGITGKFKIKECKIACVREKVKTKKAEVSKMEQNQ